MFMVKFDDSYEVQRESDYASTSLVFVFEGDMPDDTFFHMAKKYANRIEECICGNWDENACAQDPNCVYSEYKDYDWWIKQWLEFMEKKYKLIDLPVWESEFDW